LVVLLAAQVATESRKNGTTQFVLSMGTRRWVLAAAQFVALGIVLSVALLILHAGVAVAGFRTHFMSSREIGLSWLVLLLPALATAASVFSLSLTASTIETYLVFLGLPFLCRTIPQGIGGLPKRFPLFLAKGIDNLMMLFPRFDELMTWPHLSFGAEGSSPPPQWHWHAVQLAAATFFWVAFGLWLQRRHDFGSRMALK
jgi:ABC-type transport system involved in multi-copper enzyme maturation permease subunit